MRQIRAQRSLRSQSQSLSPTESLQSLQHKTLSFIAKVVDLQPPPSNVKIVSVSADWAETAMWLRAYPDDPEDQKKARRILQDYPDDGPQGQGHMSPLELAGRVEKMSHFPELEERCIL